MVRAIANDRRVRVLGVRLGVSVWGDGCSSRVFVWVFVYKANTETDTLLPARRWDLALRLALRKGVPASPLRSYPGTPFLDPPHHRCFGGVRRRAWEVSERAAGWKWRTTTRRAGRHRSVEVGGGGRRGSSARCVWWRVGGPVVASRGWHYVGDGGGWSRRSWSGGQVGCHRGRPMAHWERRGVAGRGVFPCLLVTVSRRRRAGMGVAGRSPAVKQVQVPACGGALPTLANLLDSSSTTCKGRAQLGRCPTGSKEPNPLEEP